MKISVIIPTHNRGNLIGRAIDSVLNQNLEDLEIIVVSDGSTDETDLIMEKYIDKDSRIKYIKYFPSRGANYARNKGVKESTGKYIAFLDDDDEWMPNKLEKQLKKFQEDNLIGLVYTGVKVIYVNEAVEYSSLPREKGDLSKKIFLKNLIGTTSTVMINKELFNSVGGFDEQLPALQDYDLWIRICQVSKVSYVDECLLKYYNFRGDKQISASVEKYIIALELINEKYKESLKILDKKMMISRERESLFLIVNKALRNNNANIARKYLKLSFKNKFHIKALALYVMSFVKYEWLLKLKAIKSK